MKDKFIRYRLPIFVGGIVLAIGIAGVAIAAMTITHNGSVAVQNPPPQTTYLFEVYGSESGTDTIPNNDSAYFALGTITPSAVVSKTVYVAATGTGAVTVTPTVAWTSGNAGTFSVSPASVNVSPTGTRQAVTVTFTASASPSSGNFAVTYTGSP